MAMEREKRINAMIAGLRAADQLLFGTWCAYNIIRDNPVLEFVRSFTKDDEIEGILARFYEKVWHEKEIDVEYARKIKEKLKGLTWDHEDVADSSVELGIKSWGAILFLGTHDLFFDWVLSRDVKFLSRCAENNRNIHDFLEDHARYEIEIDNQTSFLNDLIVGKIRANDLSKYARLI